jgi:hypothetical protein
MAGKPPFPPEIWRPRRQREGKNGWSKDLLHHPARQGERDE